MDNDLTEVRAALAHVSQEAADLEGFAVDLGVKLKETEAERDALKADLTRARALLDTALRLRMSGAAYDPEWMTWDRATERLLRSGKAALDHPADTTGETETSP